MGDVRQQEELMSRAEADPTMTRAKEKMTRSYHDATEIMFAQFDRVAKDSGYDDEQMETVVRALFGEDMADAYAEWCAG